MKTWTFLCSLASILLAVNLLASAPSAAQTLTNDKLSLTVNAADGSFQFSMAEGQRVFTSRVAAQVNHVWLRSTDYPRHQVTESTFSDDLGSGHSIKVAFTGLAGKPDLDYVVQVYEPGPYAAIQVDLHNSTEKELTVEALRSIEATGEPILSLGGSPSSDRVLSDSFSEDWPELHLYDLGMAPGGMHRAAGSQLIYNRQTQKSLFIGALTSDRFLTLLHLQATASHPETRITSFTADSTGTTEVQKDFDLKNSKAEDQIELSIPVAPRSDVHSERLLLQAGPDYHNQLRTYGEAIRRLHHARVQTETPIGWWSWTAFYGGINEGVTLANADWQAAHLKSQGYTYFQIDVGYQYARGEYATANATQFPDGMRFVSRRITGNGLTFGIWTGPFQVTSRAWVYEHHKDWLVHNAKGDPIPSRDVWKQKTDFLFTLDTTHPGAQEYLRQTYKTLVEEWGVRFIKLDFMDTTAIEGYRFRPNTTALEAQRIGLQIIRDTVGNDVILDKDGSPMLNAVGLVDTGRISTDTAHDFAGTREAAPGIAARFYMHRNFFVNDPDAFNTTAQAFPDIPDLPSQLDLSAAQASIALSAVSGGMYEVGDDMLVLGSQPDRLALVENKDLLGMAKLGRASIPIDLMTYDPKDEQPSIFFLAESPHQSILTVFNWTKTPRSHTLQLADLGLSAQHPYSASDVLDNTASVFVSGGVVRIENESPESVRVIKLIDTSQPAAPPIVKTQVPAAASAGDTVEFTARTENGSVPAIRYDWDFGDGTTATGPTVSHAFTRASQFTIRLTVDGIDGVPTVQNFTIKVTGTLTAFPKLKDHRRYQDPHAP